MTELGSSLPTAMVTAVRDGDTVEVETETEELAVRLTGINTPEVGECFFQEALDKAEQTLDGSTVGIEEVGTDQFGRVLAYLWIDDRMVNLEMVEDGHAVATTPVPGDPYGPRFLEAEEDAADRHLGLWGADICGSNEEVPRVTVDLGGSQTNPPGPDEDMLGEEWISLVSEEPVDLGGWTIRDESSAHRCHLAPGVELGPGQTLTVTSADACWEPGGSPVWNNGGDLALVLDPAGRVVAHARYPD